MAGTSRSVPMKIFSTSSPRTSSLEYPRIISPDKFTSEILSSGVMKQINMENCGTLPDFGNFCLERGEGWVCKKEYDRYKGVKELMPFAKAVSAKSNVFNENGDERNMDYLRIMKTVKDHGYTGYVGIEYEGNELSEDEGIIATKKLLEKVGAML